jgi:predicted ArsR family transcriptional regulator
MDRNEILASLGDEYSIEILRATHTPRSARELSELLDVPIATCYRRIEALVEAGLLAEEGRELSDRGRRSSVYRRTVDGIALTFEEGSVDLSTDDRDQSTRDASRPRDR